MKLLSEKLINKINAYERLMRLDKPIGILLLLWPTLWGLWFAAKGQPNMLVVWIFILGTVLMRSAGCVMNDWADKDFDGHVARTQHRPLATQEVHPREALWLAAGLSLGAFGLVLFLNKLTIGLSFVALFLAISYPFTKRFIAMPQAYLGIAFGMGILMAYSAITNALEPTAWLLLAANIFWAVAYDTEYAMVDKADDLTIGIHSSAILFGRFEVLAIMFCYTSTILLLVVAGRLNALNWPFYLGLLLASALAIYHYKLIKNRQPAQCFKAFLHNNYFGGVIFLGLLASFYVN